VRANDSDGDGDPLTVADFTQAANGSVAHNGDGIFTYTPDNGFLGEDSFTYTVSDGAGGTDVATVTITVVDLDNIAPVASDDSYTTDRNAPLTTTDVLADDTDANGDVLTVDSFTQAGHGAVVYNGDGIFTYTLAEHFAGDDTFTYTVTDGRGATDTATVTITKPKLTLDDLGAPALGGQEVAGWTVYRLRCTAAEAEQYFDVFGIDEIDGVHQVWGPLGLETSNADQIQFDADWEDLDTYFLFTTAQQGMGFGMSETNDGGNPTGGDFSAGVGDGTAGLGTYEILAMSLNPDDVPGQSYQFFQFVISDGAYVVVEGAASQTGAPSIPFSFTFGSPPNIAPEAADDAASTDVDTPVTTSDVLANDSDDNGDDLTVESFTQPGDGSVVDNGDGTFTYTPDGGFIGDDTFTYTISDGRGGTDTATVTITVADAANTDPDASNNSYTTDRNAPFTTTDVLGNDIDSDGDELTVDSFTQGDHGTVTYNGDGTFTYTLTEHFAGDDTFTYTVGDGRGGIDTATVTITKPKITLDELGAPTLNGEEVAGWTVYRLRCTADDGEQFFDTFAIDEVSGLHQVWGPLGWETVNADQFQFDADWADLDSYFLFTSAQQFIGFGVTETNDGSNPTGGDFTSGVGDGAAGIGTYAMTAMCIKIDQIPGQSYQFFQFVIAEGQDLTITGAAAQIDPPTFAWSVTI